MNQSIGFCTSEDGTRIAYAVSGSGPALVRPGTWMTHVEADQDGPVWGHMWRELARRNRFVRYDQRGCGLSEREPSDFSLEARVQDLEAVVDHLGLERFALFGHSHGGFTAIEYAARHPGRIDRIVLLGTAAQQWMAREVNDANVTLFRTGWHEEPSAVRMMSAYRLVPAAPHAFIEAVADLLGKSMTGHSAAALAMGSRNIDVIDRLKQVEAPTLVLHSQSQEVAQEQGRTIASLMPNARFVPLPSLNHLLLEHEPAWQTFCSAVGEFLAASEDALGPEGPALNGSTPELSSREAEVLILVAKGKSDKEIAHHLQLSTRTVSHHVKSILQKTDSANRAQAAVWAAHRAGLRRYREIPSGNQVQDGNPTDALRSVALHHRLDQRLRRTTMVDSPSSRNNANIIDHWQAGWYAGRTGASVAFATQQLAPGMDLLDVGCGAGTITLDLARIVQPGRVVGIDFNAGQIERAQANLETSGLDNVTFVQGDGTNPGFAAESFDAVVAFSTLQWLRDPARTVAKAFDLLRPRGLFAARDRDVDGDMVGGRYRDDVLAVWDMVLRVWEKERHMEPRLGRRLRGLAAEAGFAPVNVSASYESWGTDEQVAEHVNWYGLTEDRTNYDLYLRSGLADKETLRGHLERLQRWASSPDSWFAASRVEVVGWKPG